MHVADQLFVEAFEVRIGDERVSPEAVFPDWSLLDRFGIVVTEPLGGLGASLLLQLAIAKFTRCARSVARASLADSERIRGDPNPRSAPAQAGWSG